MHSGFIGENTLELMQLKFCSAKKAPTMKVINLFVRVTLYPYKLGTSPATRCPVCTTFVKGRPIEHRPLPSLSQAMRRSRPAFRQVSQC